ncbi:DUF2812 domain-containing protein [Bacillus suaedaesalsae]|uniref:DUF2812 domain-containing protein n=1 Tax=Bacillus suaedaesalsae TaxID=2810349 RepID=A0ABS2DGJ6_9BACI|nr:DUF2812 domain-containing protein [Bacillus suaedaesalsae]MBM6617145.1 DUF2812 domain-containing protein [Bacillus suaedaesalsae]
MKKFKWFANVLKEKQWINHILDKGYMCTEINFLGVYSFVPTSNSYVIQLDFQDYMSKDKFEEYKAMYEDFGWELIKGSRFGGIQYWQKAADGKDEIFSDIPSQITYYKRLKNYSSTFAILSFLYVVTIYDGEWLSGLFNIKASYLTQGLWEMEGSLFWKAFIFETPFAMLRFLLPWFFVISAVMFIYSYLQYEKKRKEFQS